MDTKKIQENTVDVSVDIYDGPHNDLFRHVVKPDPDFPGVVVIQQQERNDDGPGYTTFGEVKFDLETWAKIQYAVGVVFEKTI